MLKKAICDRTPRIYAFRTAQLIRHMLAAIEDGGSRFDLWGLRALHVALYLNVSKFLQVYAAPILGGSRAVLFANRHADISQYHFSNATVTFDLLGYDDSTEVRVRDLLAQTDNSTATSSISVLVDIHDVVMIRLTPTSVKAGYDEWRPWTTGLPF